LNCHDRDDDHQRPQAELETAFVIGFHRRIVPYRGHPEQANLAAGADWLG
jgi:hypothetical protein